ncbi:hypothetical protein E4T47_06337 [Aureobasidium subglaciale]|nr:hypothetical protein E4T47_06337 [Aureobasidium subglaciale]
MFSIRRGDRRSIHVVSGSDRSHQQTNFCNHDDKAGPLEEGSSVAIELGTLGKDGQSGTFVNMEESIPW